MPAAEAEASLPAWTAEAPAPEPRLDARPEIPPQRLETPRFGRGFAPGPARDPLGLAANRWRGTAASVGALAAAGA